MNEVNKYNVAAYYKIPKSATGYRTQCVGVVERPDNNDIDDVFDFFFFYCM